MKINNKTSNKGYRRKNPNLIDKFSKLEIVAVSINKCDGFILQMNICDVVIKDVLYLKKTLIEKGYNIYYLRHNGYNVNKPQSVYENAIFVDEFGWFITKDKMYFPKNMKCRKYDLTIFNTTYYTDYSLEAFAYYSQPLRISIKKLLNEPDKVVSNIAVIKEKDSVIKFIKRLFNKRGCKK